jgi:arylsulfatase A-like enzyme
MFRTLLCLVIFTLASFAAEKPNIVIVLADDLGINDLSCYGRKDQSTPNLDRFAGEGMRFTTAYCAQPICSPSRAAILTGRAPARLHLTTFLPGRPDLPSQKLLHPKINLELPLEEQTLAELLKAQGYVSAAVGKWHLGNKGFLPQDQGFDFVHAGKANTPPSATEGGKGEYDLTAKAIEFIEANREKPFFLYLAHNAPHIPLAAKSELVEKYRASFNPVYAGIIQTIDDTFGLLVAKLAELKLSEKTIVIFSSDNGGLHVPELHEDPATHNTPYRAGKGFLYEGGLHEPLIVRWPGHIKAGVLNETPVSLGAFVPTLLDLIGAPKPDNLDYVSFAPLLLGAGSPDSRPFFWHFPHYTNQGSRPAGAMRDGNWKLIEQYENGSAELYDLAADPGETNNLLMKEPARVAEMRGKLAAWRIAVGAQENTANPAFDPALAKPLYVDRDISQVKPAATAAAMTPALTPWRAAMDGARKAPAVQTPAALGFILLSAKDSTVHGTNLRYEPQPHKNTLGFWTKPEDWASWEIDLPAVGAYSVEVLQGAGANSGGAEVEISAGDSRLTFTVQETGHFQNFVPRTVGTLKLPAGKSTLAVKPQNKKGAAVMDLRQITLTRLAE